MRILLIFSFLLAYSSVFSQCKLYKDLTDPFEKTKIRQTKPVAMFNMHKKITFSWLELDGVKSLEVSMSWDIKQNAGTCFYDDSKLFILDQSGAVVELTANWVGDCDVNTSVPGMAFKSQTIRFNLSESQIVTLKNFNYQGCKIKTEQGKDELIFAPITGPVSMKKIGKFFNEDLTCIGF